MLLTNYLPRIEFDSYEDFKENYRLNIPEDFNFGFDIVDGPARSRRKKRWSGATTTAESGRSLLRTFRNSPRRRRTTSAAWASTRAAWFC